MLGVLGIEHAREPLDELPAVLDLPEVADCLGEREEQRPGERDALLAGFVLSLAGFPSGAAAGDVSDDAVWRLGAYYVPTILVLWMAMIAVISTYKLERKDHEQNLRELAARD